MTEIDPEVQAAFDEWLEIMRAEWHGEIPIKIHEGFTTLDRGGTPRWTAPFARWLGAPPSSDHVTKDGDEHRLRTTRAMRKLRQARGCQREFDVLYLLVAKRMDYRQVSAALTERAMRHDKPERYDETGVRILAISGLHKLAAWW